MARCATKESEWNEKAADLEAAIDDVAQREHGPRGFKESVAALVDDYETRRLLRQLGDDTEEN